MKRVMLCVLLLACGGFAARPNDDVVKPGANIDHIASAMSDAGYGETMLALVPRDEAHELKMWGVADGVLICTFAKKGKTVTALSYFFCDERPKSMRKTFTFPVKEFNPQTREMRILVPNAPHRANAQKMP